MPGMLLCGLLPVRRTLITTVLRAGIVGGIAGLALISLAAWLFGAPHNLLCSCA